MHHYYYDKKPVDLSSDFLATINCRQQAGKLDDDVPFALVISFEVEESSNVDVYEEIRQKLSIAVPVQP